MTYQPNPDAPIASERHPELYERMCKAHQFIREVLSAYVKARKANGMTRPEVDEFRGLQDLVSDDVGDQFHIDDPQCYRTLGEGFLMGDNELERLIKENWNGTN